MLPQLFLRRWWQAVLWFSAAIGTCGCEPRQGGFEQYVPSEAVAREALTSALEARRMGERPRRVDGGARGIEVADTHQRPGPYGLQPLRYGLSRSCVNSGSAGIRGSS